MSRNYQTPPSLTKPSTANPRIKDVTNQILDTHKIYGSSDSTNQNATSTGKLNYANGASLQNAWNHIIVRIPTTLHWEDTIGLAGAENEFNKFQFQLSDDSVKDFVAIQVENLGTGNTYNDSWLDTRLYSKDRIEHPGDLMYVKKNEWFYLGIHARNTRRIEYNIKIHIGFSDSKFEDIADKSGVRRLIKNGNYSG